MKALALFVLFVAFIACSNAAVQIYVNGAGPQGNSYVSTRLDDITDPTSFTAAFTVTANCTGTDGENCSASNAAWTISGAGSTPTGISISTTGPPATVTVTPSANPPEKFILTFTAPNITSGGASATRQLVVFVTNARVYDELPAVSGSWRATLITNTPSRNLQWTPSNSPDFNTDPISVLSPYNFVRNGNARPTDDVPLYWGNFYEIRLGLVTGSSYCGSNGTWPPNTNDFDVEPTPLSEDFDARGCSNWIEQGDTWSFPAPSQRIPRGSQGYDTVSPQSQDNAWSTTGPLVWSQRGATGSTLTFTGLTRPANWVSLCTDIVNGAEFIDYPCIAPRFNPDPKVWIVSATGVQPTRVTAIGTSSVTLPTVTPNNQATPVVSIEQMIQTNEFRVDFAWVHFPNAIPADTAAGRPAQAAINAVPSCAGASFTGRDPAANNPPEGINFYPTCVQGLFTVTGCTLSATVNNCIFNATEAADAGAAIGASIISASGSALSGVFISQRPLQILANGGNVAVLNPGNGQASPVELNFDSRQGTLPFTIGFPLDRAQNGTTGSTIIDNYWNFGANGTTNSGVITIRPRAVFECANEGSCLTTVGGAQNYLAGNLADFFGGTVPTFTISSANPTATISFTSLPQPTAGSQWRMFFEVQDAVTSTTVYPWSSIPYLQINVQDIEVEFVNFPPADGIFYITQPQTVAPSSYNYQVRIKRSPRSLGLASIAINFAITGASNPIQFFVNGAQITQFVFTEWQTVINFQVYTSQTPVGPFQITFTDATSGTNSFLSINPGATGDLFVRANPISVKTQSGRIEGPFVGEPFFLELTFTPPAASGFTVTASGSSIAQQTVTASAAAGDTGVILGPLTPVLPSNIELSVDSYQLPIALAVSGTEAYSIVSVVSVTVFRHTFVVTNALSEESFDDADITLYTLGERSVPYCITTNYPVFNSTLVTATDSVSITFASVASGPLPGLIFEPAAVVLSQATPSACVTIRADRNFNWDSLRVSYPVSYDVQAYLGGSLAGMFQNPEASSLITDTETVWDFPHTVFVDRLELTVELDPSYVTGSRDLYALGETVKLYVYTDILPAAGLNYTIRASGGVSLVPSTAASGSTTSHGRFAATTPGAPGQWQAWDVTFNGFAGDTEGDDGYRTVTFNLYLSSSDAAFYRETEPNPLLDAVADAARSVNVTKRGVVIEMDNDEIQIQSFVDGSATVLVYLEHPVVNGLNVSLHARTTNGVSSGGLSFSPASVQFTPGGANSHAFTVTGNLLGDYEIAARLSGADADWFDFLDEDRNDEDGGWDTISVVKRSAPVITSGFLGSASGNTINAGVTYGPVGLTLESPLQLGESVTITPSGSDFTFSPASITLGPGQSQALFSFTYLSQTSASKAVVFFTISGPDAWKYDTALVRQEYDVAFRAFTVTFQGSNAVVPGVAHEGYITLPFAVTSNLVVTPLALGAGVTFNPAQWTFTPQTGNVLHFTYTVGSVQAFELSSAGLGTSGTGNNPATNAVQIQVAYLVNGTDAAVFAPTGITSAFTVVRPSFNIDATYSASGVVINPNEQAGSNIYTVGRWSPVYSVHLSAAPASGSVTLTLTDSLGVIDFAVGDSDSSSTSATLTFTADSYVQYFRFRFNTLLTGDATYTGFQRLSVGVTGANAEIYDINSIYNAFSGLIVVPALAFSPIPAIYTDGVAEGLFVAVKSSTGAIGGAWPYGDNAQFSLHIIPWSTKGGVVVEPSTLEFSKSQSDDPVQSYSIHHTNPRIFGRSRTYPLQWLIRFAGSTAVYDITSVVPQDAQQVLLARYQVIPDFPHVLSYGWQKASFNISHIPVAHISFIPKLPPIDGSSTVQGATTPAGRVDFEPPVIVVAPGQQVVEFQVKAQPGVHRDNLYYRVDWEMRGHVDDLVNFVEYLQVGASGLANDLPTNDRATGFATWHLASAGINSISVALVAIVCLLALVRNMY